MHCFIAVAALVAALALLHPAAAAEPGKQTNSARAPSAETTNALAAFQVKRGFRIELVASATLVSSPVAMAFDENGRLFVAEMRDYPDRRNENPHLGRIRLLEDTDGDGVFDTSRIYADNLAWPSAVACYDGGVFVAATPDIIYFKDTKGNGNADVRRVVCTGFGGSTNVLSAERLLNNFNWGPDDRIHGATAGIGGVVAVLGAPGAGLVSLARADFSFDPRSLLISPEPGPGQSGLTFDNHGRKFICDPTRPLRTPMYDPRYTPRNPFFSRPSELIDAAPPATPIFRFAASNLPKPGISGRAAGTTPAGAVARATNGLMAAWCTNAHGCVSYRGNIFPANYLENVFIADPAANVIHRAVLRENELEVVAERATEEQNTEFLLSRDASFHPMQIINGPDGALYVADLREGGDTGAIYRIVPQTFKQPKVPQLGKAKTYDLVATLAQANGWHCDTAARLLYERRDPAAVSLLTNMLNNSQLPLARLHALRALRGLGALKEAMVLKGLGDSDEHVREVAVKLSEELARDGAISDAMWNQLRPLGADPSIRVRYQLAFTLGQIRRAERNQSLAEILRRNPDNHWFQTAVLSSLAEGAGELFVMLAGDASGRGSAAGQDFLRQAAIMIGVKGRQEEVAQVLEFVKGAGLEPQAAFSLLHALGEGLHRTGSSLALVDPQNQLQPFYDQTLIATLDDSLPEPLRLAAIGLRGVSPQNVAGTADFFQILFGTGQSVAVQAAAIASLGHYASPEVPANLLARWQELTPWLRNEAISALLRRSDRANAVLGALESGAIQAADLSSTQVDFLRTHYDPAISRRAVQLLGPLKLQRPEAVEPFRPALRLKGTPAHGREIFLARCAACHQLGGEGHALGPELAAAKVHGRDRLLRSILDPNSEVRPEYAAQVVKTKTGECWLGVLRDENVTTITLGQPIGADVVLPRSNIEFIQAQLWSLMPEGLENGLTPQSMADLLEYIITAPR